MTAQLLNGLGGARVKTGEMTAQLLNGLGGAHVKLLTKTASTQIINGCSLKNISHCSLVISTS